MLKRGAMKDEFGKYRRMRMNLGAALFAGFLSLSPIASGQSTFPDTKDLRDVTIVLQRGGGMGGGPSYRLSISGDGNVAYEGYAGVFTKGNRRAHISNVAMEQLLEEFRKAHFFELQDAYQSAATDLPVCITQFHAGPNSKKVVDYGLSSSDQDRLRSGAPQDLLQLETRIAQIAGSKKWVDGSWLRRLLHWH
jgi:hypothetical protein